MTEIRKLDSVKPGHCVFLAQDFTVVGYVYYTGSGWVSIVGGSQRAFKYRHLAIEHVERALLAAGKTVDSPVLAEVRSVRRAGNTR